MCLRFLALDESKTFPPAVSRLVGLVGMKSALTSAAKTFLNGPKTTNVNVYFPENQSPLEVEKLKILGSV